MELWIGKKAEKPPSSTVNKSCGAFFEEWHRW